MPVTATPPVFHDGPLRVVAFGDSLMHTLIGGRLTGRYEEVEWTPPDTSFDAGRIEITSAARTGCTFLPGEIDFAVPDGDCDGWRDAVTFGLGTSDRPADALLVLLSNDLGDRTVDGTDVTSGSDEHVALITELFDELRSTADDRGALTVLLVPPPRVEPGTTTAMWDREIRFRAIVDDYARRHTDVAVLDLGAALCPGDDCSRPPDGFEPNWRFDGLHFTNNGARWVADWLTPFIENFVETHRVSGLVQ